MFDYHDFNSFSIMRITNIIMRIIGSTIKANKESKIIYVETWLVFATDAS